MLWIELAPTRFINIILRVIKKTYCSLLLISLDLRRDNGDNNKQSKLSS